MSKSLESEQALQYVHAAIDIANRQYGGRPLSVAVCDANGDLLAYARMDGAKLMTIRLTQMKARTAARMGTTTKDFMARLQRENLEISFFGDDQFTALPGGIPVKDSNGAVIGGVACGGLSAVEDHESAEKTVAAVKL
jgi:uncharacterized protein GlcG (DUF336 family)